MDYTCEEKSKLGELKRNRRQRELEEELRMLKARENQLNHEVSEGKELQQKVKNRWRVWWITQVYIQVRTVHVCFHTVHIDTCNMRTRLHMQTYTRVHTNSYTHKHRHTNTCTQTHPFTHTCTHIYTQSMFGFCREALSIVPEQP